MLICIFSSSVLMVIWSFVIKAPLFGSLFIVNGNGLVLNGMFLYIFHCHRIIFTINKIIFCCLVLRYPELAVDIIFKLVIVPV